jgi:tripartite-type tricarboxylate transporter receptor subunit TctC
MNRGSPILPLPTGLPFSCPGTPEPIVETLHAAAVATMDTPYVRLRMKEIGADPIAPDRRSREYLQRFVASEVNKWAALIRASGAAAN